MRSIQRGIFKFFCFIVGIAFVAQIVAGSEVQINYNRERAAKAKQTFWNKTIRVAQNIGDFKRAIW